MTEFFQSVSPVYVLGTTYTLSLAFFEAVVFRNMDRTHLRRCVVLCDQFGFQSALQEASALRFSGREYMALCVPCSGTFHPKVWLLVGDDEAAILVGSGNLTQTGFATNLELFDAVKFDKGQADPALINDVTEFLDGLGQLWKNETRQSSLQASALAEMQNALRAFASYQPLAASSKIRFLSSINGPLVDQMSPFFKRGTLHVASPYFGAAAAGVQLLRDKLDVGPIRVFPALHGDSLDVPLKEISKVRDTTAHRLSLSKKHSKFAHLKAYGCESPEACWVFTTSANCTQQALAGSNVEAGLMRSVDNSVLRALFAEDASGKLPTKLRENEWVASDSWAPMTATDRESYIELVIELPTSSLPLTNASISVEYAGQSKQRSFSALFANGSLERIPWSGFPKMHDRYHGTAVLRLEATANGKHLRGAAFVDQPALLTSDPIHRSAWRATLAILGSEGLPDASDLACVFHLFEGLFRPIDEPTTEDSTEDNKSWGSKAGKIQTEVGDKTPLWPPTSLDDAPPLIHSGRGQTIQWFQKILSELLSAGRSTTDTTTRSSIEIESDEEMDFASQVVTPQIQRASATVWTYASNAFDRLVDQLQQMRLTEATAKKIWPVSIAIFLATLASRKQVLKSNPAASVPPTAELTSRYLFALFGDRYFDDEASAPTDESVATLLHSEFETVPPDDIAGIVRTLFAVQFPDNFFLEGWLRFRDIAPPICAPAPPLPELERLFTTFLHDESRPMAWSEVVINWEKLPQIDWRQHPGHQELTEIIAWASGSSADLPLHLPESCRQLRVRIRSGKAWWFEVSRFNRLCLADGCSRRYQKDPTKAQLAHFRPVICTACGSLLVPDLLAQSLGKSS